MSKKIRITESQLKILLESNKKGVNEQDFSDRDGSGDEFVPTLDNSDDQDLISRITEKLTRAVDSRDWSLVSDAISEIQGSQGVSKEDEFSHMNNNSHSGDDGSRTSYHDDNIMQMSESIKKIKSDFNRFM